jgi:glucokinase
VPAIGHGGLVRFAPECIEELQMLAELAGDIDFIPAEALISKPGIVAVYQLLRKRNGRAVEPIGAVEIATAAQSEDPDAKSAIAHFSRWLGRFAGDIALTFGALGGVYIGGSVTTNIDTLLELDALKKAFKSKGRMTDYLATIPLYIIRTPNVGLEGAAIAARPS